MNDKLALQPLGGGVQIYTNNVHKFGTDAILLANFAAVRINDVACDLGTGCGIIPLLWCRGSAPKRIVAVDIQRDAAALVKSSVELNGLGGRISPLCADLNALPGEMAGSFTLVTMNPPYKRLSDGVISPEDGRAIARHEIKCNLDGIIKAAARLLKPSGRLCMCHRPERLADLLCAMRAHGIEPKRLCTVSQRANSAPSLVLCEGRKGGAVGMTVDAPLIIETESGGYTAKMKEIYAEFESAREEA